MLGSTRNQERKAAVWPDEFLFWTKVTGGIPSMFPGVIGRTPIRPFW